MLCPLCTEVAPKVECPHAKASTERETRVDTLVAENGRLKAERESLTRTIAILARENAQLFAQVSDLQWAGTDALERERALKLRVAELEERMNAAAIEFAA
jgi:regulator of replication initiation timing